MLLDIILIMIVGVYFFIGRKREVVLEFFNIFKLLLILFLMNFFYPRIEKILKYNIKNIDKDLDVYIIIFLVLYVIFSVLLKFCNKFLKSIKLKKLNKTLGGFLGIIESTFIIFIIYILILLGSKENIQIKNQRERSKIVEGITEYGYIYMDIFPDFIKKEIEIYRRIRKKQIIKNKILKEYRENKKEKEIKRDESKNN